MEKKKIVILFGGCSTEYSVSLQSAYAVMKGIDAEKYEVISLGITRDGRWLRYLGDWDRIPEDHWQEQETIPACISPDRKTHGLLLIKEDGQISKEYVDLVFPVLHGKNGEDGTVQGLCDLAGIPYVGCGTLSSALCMDKDIAHIIAKAAGVEVPAYVLLREYMDIEEQRHLCADLEYPVFVKPARAGSSYGITRVEAPGQLKSAIEAAFQHDTKVVIEAAVPGFEVGCAVLGEKKLLIGAVDEIELHTEVFDFHEKYTLETSRIHVPARIDAVTAARLKETAGRLYRALECRGMSRVDMFLTPDGRIVFNEINTIPGFTSHSRYPNMMKAEGHSFEEILEKLIQEAVH